MANGTGMVGSPLMTIGPPPGAELSKRTDIAEFITGNQSDTDILVPLPRRYRNKGLDDIETGFAIADTDRPIAGADDLRGPKGIGAGIGTIATFNRRHHRIGETTGRDKRGNDGIDAVKRAFRGCHGATAGRIVVQVKQQFKTGIDSLGC